MIPGRRSGWEKISVQNIKVDLTFKNCTKHDSCSLTDTSGQDTQPKALVLRAPEPFPPVCVMLHAVTRRTRRCERPSWSRPPAAPSSAWRRTPHRWAAGRGSSCLRRRSSHPGRLSWTGPPAAFQCPKVLIEPQTQRADPDQVRMCSDWRSHLVWIKSA